MNEYFSMMYHCKTIHEPNFKEEKYPFLHLQVYFWVFTAQEYTDKLEGPWKKV